MRLFGLFRCCYLYSYPHVCYGYRVLHTITFTFAFVPVALSICLRFGLRFRLHVYAATRCVTVYILRLPPDSVLPLPVCSSLVTVLRIRTFVVTPLHGLIFYRLFPDSFTLRLRLRLPRLRSTHVYVLAFTHARLRLVTARLFAILVVDCTFVLRSVPIDCVVADLIHARLRTRSGYAFGLRLRYALRSTHTHYTRLFTITRLWITRF